MASLMAQRFGVFKNPCPSILNLRKESFPKGCCCKFLTRSRVVVAAVAGVSTSIQDRERQNILVLRERRKLKEMFEEACERCITSPMEGVNFTFEEFDAAVEKYDFNIEIGSKVKGTVYSVDANGALVDITAKSSGYLPLTEASIHNIKHVKEAGIFPGLVEEFVVVEENEADDGWILSLRSIQKDLAWERCRQLQAEDVIVKGKVIEANKGGVVVILECIQGFVPFSQISNKYTGDELLGKELPLKFLEMDEERGRIVLSNRNAVADNGQAQVVVGSVITGTVQSLKPYGAFIDMGGISGLLHISQISHDRVADISTVLQPGDTLKAMVLHHDRERGRVTLSTKRLEPSPGDMIRNPKLVFEKAEEMVEKFSQRILAHANQLMPEDGLMLNSDGIFDI